jgi:hypothetical protein
MKFHPPFNSFGAGIFNALESAERAVVLHFIEEEGKLPREFSPFCDCTAMIEYPKHWSKFRYTHKSGVVLYGVPDEILLLKDGTLCVLDYKTAKAKGNDDPFHSQYEIQVVGYANIAEIGLNLGTVYWEVQTDAVLQAPEEHYDSSKTLYVPFKPAALEIEIDYSLLDPLVKEAKKVWATTVPPSGRDNCKDCQKLDALFALEQEVECEDAWMLKSMAFTDQHASIIGRHYMLRSRRLQALSELIKFDDRQLDSESMAANWETGDQLLKYSAGEEIK